MNTLIQAGEDAERLSSLFSGLAGLSAELKRVGSLQQAADEAQTRIDKAKTESDRRATEALAQAEVVEKRLAGLKEEHVAANAAIAEANAERTKILDAAQARAADIVAAAQSDAASARSTSEYVGAKIVADAKVEADRMRADLKLAHDELNDLRINAADAQKRRDDALAELARLKGLFGGGA